MILSWAAKLGESVDRSAERMVASRFPFVMITLWALLAAFVLTSFPDFGNVYHLQPIHERVWTALFEKRDNLFGDVAAAHPEDGHIAKMNFRILVPAVARIFGLGKTGVFVFQCLCGVALFWVVSRVTHKITGDLVSSLYVTCGVASTWAGTTCFLELRGLFDGEAILLLALSTLLEIPVFTAACVFLCAFTDERGLIASSLVYLYHVNRRHRQGHGEIASLFGPVPLAVVAGWVAYFAARSALAHYYGLTTDFDTANLSVLTTTTNMPLREFGRPWRGAGCWYSPQAWSCS